MEEQYILEMIDIQKRFPGVQALKNAGIKVRKGTVHALMGENGAGKSTLMKILGVCNPQTPVKSSSTARKSPLLIRMIL